jgi:NADPH:quinone reductase
MGGDKGCVAGSQLAQCVQEAGESFLRGGRASEWRCVCVDLLCDARGPLRQQFLEQPGAAAEAAGDGALADPGLGGDALQGQVDRLAEGKQFLGRVQDRAAVACRVCSLSYCLPPSRSGPPTRLCYRAVSGPTDRLYRVRGLSMRALIADPSALRGVALAEVPEPAPGADQLIIEVHHASLNFGEARHPDLQPPGAVMGFDAAGTVVQAAARGQGPVAGQRVVAFGPGAWAERAAFDTGSVAVVPDGLNLAEAAALPLVGLTALRTLRAAGLLVGRRVLITGASGGVGRLAVQLARLGGAYVIAAVGSRQRGEGLAALGAHEVITGLDQVAAPVDVILELIGGAQLVTAWSLLKPGGTLQSIGWASGEPAAFPPDSIFALGPAKTLQSFGDPSHAAPDLATLVQLAAAGSVTIDIGWHGPWSRIAEAIDALLGRTVNGKAVIDIDHPR